MGQSTVVFKVDNLNEDWYTFNLTITTKDITADAGFMAYTDEWREFGQALQLFPENLSSRVSFEAGVDNPSDTHIKLEAYCYDAFGHSALHVFTDNKSPEPNRRRLEFSIPAEAASINDLGKLLSSWQVKNDSEIQWEAQTS